MRKLTAGALSAVLFLSGTTGIVTAEETQSGGAMTMLEEMYSMEYMQVTETMSMQVAGGQIDIEGSFVKGPDYITDFDMSVSLNVPEEGLEYQMVLEDVFRILPDGCYINVGAFIDAVEELAGEDSVSYVVDMVDLTEPWIVIPAADLVGFPYDRAGALLADMQSKYYAEGSMFDGAVEIDGGYQMTTAFDEYYEAMIKDILNVADENLTTWLDEGIAIIKELDIPATVNPYLEAVVAGISEVDPEVDASSIDGLVESALEMIGYPDCLDTFAAEVKEMLAEAEAEGVTLASLSDELVQQFDSAMFEDIMDYTWSIVKTEEGYLIAADEKMVMDTEEITAHVELTAVPVESVDVTAPESCVELKDLVKSISGIVYMMGLYDDSDATDEYTEPSVYFEEDRVLVTNPDKTIGWWVTYDTENLALDLAFSDEYSVFLDLADYSNYVTLSIDDYNSFATICENEKAFGMEYYTSYTMTDIAVSTDGGVELQYCFVTATDEDGYEYNSLYFGTDIGESMCIAGTLDMYDETEEEALTIMHQAIAGLEEFIVE